MKYCTVEKRKISTARGKMKIIILHPIKNKKEKSKTPGVLWIHGGGYVTGMSEMVFMSRAKNLVKKYGAVVISPEYTLAGKAPYPAAIEDCYDALLYMKDHADELGISSNRIMVGGESAGGGLTAALCILARDRNTVKIAYQMPIYPMLDDRDTETSRDNHGIIWNTTKNHKAWKKYLRDIKNSEIPPYAAPARETDYSGLPPAYTFIGDADAFLSEAVEYIENLKRAGVEASINIYHKGFHSFDLFTPWQGISKAAIAKFEKSFEYAMENYNANQNNGGCTDESN